MTLSAKNGLFGLMACLVLGGADCFVSRTSASSSLTSISRCHDDFLSRRQRHLHVTKLFSSNDSNDSWDGNVVSSNDGKIPGCTLQQVSGSLVDWTLTIDGVQADLGRFSQAIYKKIVTDAKRERFQGFKPGTIPPHLEPTYRGFAMDECARETVLEALQQNNIRPFETCRQDMILESVSIPPVAANNKASKKKKKKTSKNNPADEEETTIAEPAEWRVFATMKEALDAGWRPGQSFSFVARDVKGQLVKDDLPANGSSLSSLGIGGE